MNKLLKISGALVLVGALFLVALLIYVQANQESLIRKVKAKLDQNINGELTIGKIQLTIFNEFPKLSLTLRDFSVKDSLYKKEIFVVEKIYLRVNPMQLFSKQIDFSKVSLEEGRFFLLRDSSGYLNANIFKFKSGGKTSMDFDLQELDIRNLHFSFHEENRGQHISFTLRSLKGTIPPTAGTPIMHLSGLMHIDSVMFKSEKGSFFKNKLAGLELQMSLERDKNLLVIHPSKFEIDKQFYDGKGFFDFTNNPGLLHLEFSNPKTNYSVAKGILPDKILGYMKDIELQDSVDVRVLVHGVVLPDFPPEVDAHFDLNNATMQYGGIHLTNFTMKGLFMNHVVPGVSNKDPNSALRFEVPFVKVEGIPLSANMVITDLKALNLAVNASSKTPLLSFNGLLPPNGGRFTEGDLDMAVSYQGTLSAYVKATERRGNDSLGGYVKITDGGFAYDARGLKLTKINTDMALDELKIDISNLSASLNDNPVSVKGYIDGVSRFLSNNNQKMTGHLVLHSPRFNLSNVLTKKNLAQMKAAPKDATGKGGKAASAAISRLMDDLTLKLNFSSPLFMFRKFVASKVHGEVTISTHGMQLRNFNLNTCKGSVTVNGGLLTDFKNDQLNAEVLVSHVNVKEFMNNANNFYQSAITAENLNGNLSASVRFSSPLDLSYTPLTDSMKGYIYFSLRNGRLSNFSPIADIGKFIFKKRDFNNVTFDEIEDSVTLDGMNLTVQRMEIASNILRMFIQGSYQINGQADLTIQVPWNNLKKQDLNYIPTNIGVDAKTGASIYLRVRGGGQEKVKVTWDTNAKNRLKKEKML